GAVWTAVQVPLFGGAVNRLAARRARYVTRAWRQRRKGWIEVLDHVLFATYHHAVTAFQTPHPTARPDVHVVDPFRRKFLCASNVVHIIGVPPVDEDVPCLKMGQKV